MKRYLLTAILILASCSLFAACGANTVLANAAIPCVSGLSAIPANVTARAWIQGLNNPVDGLGTDSDGIPSVDTACVFDGSYVLGDWAACAGGNPGEYYILTDWITLAYDGCPGVVGTERGTLLAYDTNGNYTLQSRTQTEGWGAWDTIGTVAAAPLSAATGTATTPDSVTTDINWTALPASVTLGSYSGIAPGTPFVTTFNVYTYTGAAAPVNFATSAWTLLASGVAEGTALSNYTFADPGAGVGMYLSRSIIIEGMELPWVSTSYITLYDPSGAPTMSGVSAVNSGLNTTVNWTSGDESQITGYQVFFAPTGGEFTAVGNRINPAGNNHDYSTSVRIPSTSGFTVKVGAYLTSGSVEYSSPVSVKVTNIINDKTRVNVD